MNVSYRLSPGLPVLAQWAYELLGHGDRVRVYIWSQKLGFHFIKANMATATDGNSTCQQHKLTLSPQLARVTNKPLSG